MAITRMPGTDAVTRLPNRTGWPWRSSAEAGFRPGHRDRRRRHYVGLYKPRTLELFVKMPTLSVQWHRYHGRSDTVFLHGSRYHSFRICDQTLLSASGACSRSLSSSQQACHFGGVDNPGRAFGGVRSTAARMVAQHAVRDALVAFIDTHPIFEQGIIIHHSTGPLAIPATVGQSVGCCDRWMNRPRLKIEDLGLWLFYCRMGPEVFTTLARLAFLFVPYCSSKIPTLS